MRTIAIVNQKGGCGKTTTSINLSACLSAKKRKVLIIDLDPQSHATIGLNQKVEELETSVYDIFTETSRKSLDEAVLKYDEYLDIAPSQLILSAVEQELAGRPDRSSILFGSILRLKKDYDYIIIDCPPSLGLLTFNALRACSEVIIPIDISVFSLQGVARLFETINLLKSEFGHEIRTMALTTNCNPRTLFAAELLSNIKNHFKKNIYQTIIHSTVKLREAAGFGMPIIEYDNKCRGALDYTALAGEILREEKKIKAMNSAVKLGPVQVDGEVIFSYYDPNAHDVQIAGDFNNWDRSNPVKLTEKHDKIWKGTIQLSSGRYQYKFIVDGEWKVDPNNPEVNSDRGIKNSILKIK